MIETNKIITFLEQRIEEYLKKFMNEKTHWEDKKECEIKMREDLVILEVILGKPVNIKTEITW